MKKPDTSDQPLKVVSTDDSNDDSNLEHPFQDVVLQDESGISAFSVGRRKRTTANVFMTTGSGLFFVNGIPMASHFKRLEERLQCVYPFELTDTFGKFDTWALVSGFTSITSCQHTFHLNPWP